jgi:hypothetical protein
LTLAMVMTSVAPAGAQPPPTPAPTPTPAPAPGAEAPTPGRREPSAGDLMTARNALREGLSLREKGDLATALVRLGSAYDLVPTPVTGFELGKTHMMLGHVLQAHELFKKVVRMPASLEESTRSQTSRDEAARLAKEIEPRIPSLRIKLTLPPGASAVVRVDDDVITAAPGAETIRSVDPGPHDVFAKAGDGPEQKVHIEVAESETKDVPLAPQWIPPKAPPPGRGRDIIYVRTTNPLAFIGFGVAAAAIIVTGIGVVVFLNASADARAKCDNSFCPPSNRSPNLILPSTIADDELNAINTRQGVSGLITIVAGITAVVFTGVGIVGVARPVRERVVGASQLPPPPPVRIKPLVGLGNIGLSGTF